MMQNETNDPSTKCFISNLLPLFCYIFICTDFNTQDIYFYTYEFSIKEHVYDKSNILIGGHPWNMLYNIYKLGPQTDSARRPIETRCSEIFTFCLNSV